MARLLLGVTGGIAAYKAILLARLATEAGHALRVVQTPSSLKFVGTESFRALTGAPVLVDEDVPDPMRGAYPGDVAPTHEPITHLALVEQADVLLVAPATANTIAGFATGRTDGLLGAAYLAAACPVVVAPAMNHRMWHHPATRRNLAQLEADGARVVPPGSGRLASRGEDGDGRLAEPGDLLAAVEAVLAGPGVGRAADLVGTHVLVTAGGTREPIDAVRYVGNRSSGRMGYALAERAAARGARVTLVAANVALDAPRGVTVVPVRTAEELRQATGEAFGDADVLVMAAAVADFRPAAPDAGKIKKDGRERLDLGLEPTVDVLAEVSARRRPGQVLVGFAAEHGPDGPAHARGKLERKGLDLVVHNDVSVPGIAFDATENAVTLVSAEGDVDVPRAGKGVVADAILDAVVARRP